MIIVVVLLSGLVVLPVSAIFFGYWLRGIHARAEERDATARRKCAAKQAQLARLSIKVPTSQPADPDMDNCAYVGWRR